MQNQTSFIPKKDYLRDKKTNKTYAGLATVVAGVIFVAMVFIAAGVFFYEQFLVSEIGKNSAILEREKGNLDVETIQKLAELDKRIESAKEILDKHISLIPLFELLEKNTLKTVSFDNFNFAVEKDGITLDMDGIADSYTAVALQSDIFGKNKNIVEPIFSNLGVNFNGDVTFTVLAKIDPRVVLFRNSLEAE